MKRYIQLCFTKVFHTTVSLLQVRLLS